MRMSVVHKCNATILGNAVVSICYHGFMEYASNQRRSSGIPKRTTVRDVAQAAGVSIATVSRALNNPGRVNGETAKHVIAIAQQLGYHTTPPQQLDNKQLRGIILILTAVQRYSIYNDFIDAIHQRCIQRGFMAVSALTGDQSKLERQFSARMIPHVDAVIAISPRLPESTIHQIARSTPLVLINRIVQGIPSIISGDRQSISEAIQALQDRGCSSLTYICPEGFSWQNGLRWQATLQSCKARRIALHRITIKPDWNAINSLQYSGFQQFFDNPSDAVFCFNDALAVSLMRQLDRYHIRVPEDVRVIGIDDAIETHEAMPTLSSIAIPRKEMGYCAADIAMNTLLHTTKQHYNEPIVLPSHFVARESIGRID